MKKRAKIQQIKTRCYEMFCPSGNSIGMTNVRAASRADARAMAERNVARMNERSPGYTFKMIP